MLLLFVVCCVLNDDRCVLFGVCCLLCVVNVCCLGPDACCLLCVE